MQHLDRPEVRVRRTEFIPFRVMGQTHVHRYMRPLLERIERGDLDPSSIVTHRARLDEAPGCYSTFNEKEDSCVKVVLKP